MLKVGKLSKGSVTGGASAAGQNPDEFTFVERWTSREALEVHFHTPDMATWREIGADCVAARKVEIVSPAHVETL